METCKVELTNQNGQKIILDFSLDNTGNLDYKPSFKPEIIDPKTDMGLAGRLCAIFISALHNSDQLDKTSLKDNGAKRDLKN